MSQVSEIISSTFSKQHVQDMVVKARSAPQKRKARDTVATQIPHEEKRANLWALLAVLVLAALIYSNSLSNGFVYFDDPQLVTENYFIRQISWENLRHYFAAPIQFTYQPIGLISYAIDYQIGQLDPFIYHLDNLVIHLLTIGMVYWVFLSLTQKSSVSIFVALVFAIHPVNVDSVAWVATRNNLLTSFFYLAALLFYSFYLKAAFRIRYLVFSCIAFVLSVLSKSSSVVLPLTLLLWDYYFGRKWNRRLLLEKIPFAIIALIFGIQTLIVRQDVVPPVVYNAFDRIVLFCYALTDYMVRLLLPVRLSMSYAYPEKSGDLLPAHLYLAPFVLGLVVWGLSRLGIPKKTLVVGFSFFVLNIFLSQSVLLIDNFMANRYAYLSYLGLFLVLAEINERALSRLSDASKSKLKIAWLGVLAIFVVGFSGLTYSRNYVWKDSISLFDDVIRKQPSVPWVYSNRGIAKYRANDLEGALSDFNHSLTLDPNFALSLYYRGVISYLSGDHDAALVDLNQVISMVPDFAPAYNDRAKLRIHAQDHQGALDDLAQAVAIDGSLVDAYFNRGSLKNELGDYAGAVADLDSAISLLPDHAAALYVRGIAKSNLNGPDACQDIEAALSMGYQPAAGQPTPNCP